MKVNRDNLPERETPWSKLVREIIPLFLGTKRPKIFISYPWVAKDVDYPDDRVFGPYRFSLVNELPREKLEWDKLYLTKDGHYCVLKEKVKNGTGKEVENIVEGVLEESLVEDIGTKFHDPLFIEKVQEFTTKAGHTRPIIDLSQCDIQTEVKKLKAYLEDIFTTVDDTENYVHMDLTNNDHGGTDLAEQIKGKISTYDFVICFLTPLYRAKVEHKKPDGTNYVLRLEFDEIEKRDTTSKKVFRFIMAGERKNAAPQAWVGEGKCSPLITDQGDKKSKLARLQFILRKLLIHPDRSGKFGEDIFNEKWSHYFPDPTDQHEALSSPKSSALSSKQAHLETTAEPETQSKEFDATIPWQFHVKRAGAVTNRLKNSTINMQKNSHTNTSEDYYDLKPGVIEDAGVVADEAEGIIINML